MPSNRDTIELRSKCSHFRILVIGRANAGKTTLLKKVCNSAEDPEIYSPSGHKIHPGIVEGSAQRGEHNIKNQLIFKSNPRFIFHDSRGFQSGSSDELEQVTAFIVERAGSNELSQQLHAIWYCLPTDTNRPFLAADELVFNTSITGKVPVIVIFTKFDGLVTEAFTELVDRGARLEDAANESIDRAKKMLAKHFEARLDSSISPPAARVRLDDMREESSRCHELIEETANTLSDETLRLLFVSVQQNNIDLCVRYAVHGTAFAKVDLKGLVENTLACFPHIWLDEEYDVSGDFFPVAHGSSRAPFMSPRQRPQAAAFFENVRGCVNTLETKYPGVVDAVTTESGRAEVLAALCIIMEQTFIETSAKQQAVSAAFSAALDVYLGSPLQESVNGKIAKLPPSQQDKMARIGSLTKLIMLHRLRINSPQV